jgi:hypothetical protein
MTSRRVEAKRRKERRCIICNAKLNYRNHEKDGLCCPCRQRRRTEKRHSLLW